jgi:hypothetical protein
MFERSFMQQKLFFSLAVLLLTLSAGQATLSQTQQKPSKSASSVKPGARDQEGTAPGTPTQSPDTVGQDRATPPLAFSARIVEVLHITATEAGTWENRASAAKIQAEVADLTWEFDPPNARGYLLQAWETAGKLKEESLSVSAFRNSSRRAETQRAVLLVARKRDQSLAEKWLADLAAETQKNHEENPADKPREWPARSSILLGMALSVVAENPQAAAELATASLQDGISFELQAVLLALQDQSFELAQGVFRAALTHIRLAGIQDPNELLTLHSYLYTPGRVRVAGAGDKPANFQMAVGREQKNLTAAAKLKPELAREFLHTAAEALLRLPFPSATANPQESARMQFNVINVIAGELLQLAPERAAALQARAQNIVADARFSTGPAVRQTVAPALYASESQKNYDERRVDTLEELAKKETNPLSRDIAFAKAALATSVLAYERGWSLAGQIREKAFRADITNWLTYRASLHFIGTKDFVKARGELIEKNEDFVQRAASLIIGAQKLLTSKDQLQARAWLQEASNLLNKADKEQGVLAISFGIVAAYGSFDRPLALNALEQSIKLLNQWPSVSTLEEKAPLSKRFAGLPVSDFTYGTKGFGLASVAAAFPLEAFEAVLGLLQDLKHPEIKGQLITKICQQHLKAKHPPAGQVTKPAPSSPRSAN